MRTIQITTEIIGVDTVVSEFKRVKAAFSETSNEMKLFTSQIKGSMATVNRIFSDTSSLVKYGKQLRHLEKTKGFKKLNLEIKENGQVFDRATNKAMEYKAVLARIGTTFKGKELMAFNRQLQKFGKTPIKRKTDVAVSQEFDRSLTGMTKTQDITGFLKLQSTIDLLGLKIKKTTTNIQLMRMAMKKLKGTPVLLESFTEQLKEFRKPMIKKPIIEKATTKKSTTEEEAKISTVKDFTRDIVGMTKTQDVSQFLRMGNTIKLLGLKVSKTTTDIKLMNMAMRKLKRTPSLLMPFNKQLDAFNTKQSESIRGVNRFKMEYLGIMFLGMSIAGFFQRLIQPVMETFGIFDMFSATLLTVFIPVMEELQPSLFSAMEWFMNLDEQVQLNIGRFVTIGLVLSTALMAVGMMTIGLASFFKALSGFKIIASIGTSIASFISLGLAPMIIIIGLVIIATMLLYKAWKTNFGNIREHTESFVNGIKRIIIGFKDVIVGLFKAMWALINLDLKGFNDAFSQIWEGIWNGIIGGAQEMLTSFIDWVKDTFLGLISWLDTKFLGGKLKDIWNSDIVVSIRELYSGIKEKLTISEKQEKMPTFEEMQLKYNNDNITEFATGGIVTRPTLGLVGEAGPEAIIPLDKLNTINNGGDIYYQPTYNIGEGVIFKDELDKRMMLNELNKMNQQHLDSVRR